MVPYSFRRQNAVTFIKTLNTLLHTVKMENPLSSPGSTPVFRSFIFGHQVVVDFSVSYLGRLFVELQSFVEIYILYVVNRNV